MTLTDKDLRAIREALKPQFDEVAKRFDQLDNDLAETATSIKESFNEAEEARAHMENRLSKRLDNLDSRVGDLYANKWIKKVMKATGGR